MQPRLTLLALCLLAAGCGDPVHDAAVDSLGGEVKGVSPGPLHRPGQPCLVCHSGQGPADLVMTFGGTAYLHASADSPAAGATVRIVDAHSRTFETTSNDAGNFWIPERAFTPEFPVTTAITLGRYSRVMKTWMRLDGSCNGCHTQPAGPDSPGALWVLPDGEAVP